MITNDHLSLLGHAGCTYLVINPYIPELEPMIFL
jgi:hypothetical protein